MEKNVNTGLLANGIACILAVLGILFLGVIFVPLAAVTAMIGSIKAFKNKNLSSIGLNILAWILVLIGFFTSPILLAAIGLGGLGLAQ